MTPLLIGCRNKCATENVMTGIKRTEAVGSKAIKVKTCVKGVKIVASVIK